MDPNIWGPRLWFSMHSISFTYPFYPTDKDKEIYKNFYKLLEHILPCGLCRNNYKKHIEMFPIEPHLENRKKLAHWCIDMHNMVNIENKKPTLSYGEVLDIYMNYQNKNEINILEYPEPQYFGKYAKHDHFGTWKK